MTRRERAAMALALEVLRGGPEPDERCSCHGGVVHAPDGLVTCVACDGHGILVDPLISHMQWAADILLSEDACAPVTTEVWEAVAVQAGGGGEFEERLIRARLALYLRARLRAEGGERGERERRVCGHCGHWDIRRKQVGRGRSERAVEYCDRCRCTWFRWVPVGPPLWQQAPAHGHWRHRCTGGRPVDLPRGEECDECGERDPRRGGA